MSSDFHILQSRKSIEIKTWFRSLIKIHLSDLNETDSLKALLTLTRSGPEWGYAPDNTAETAKVITDFFKQKDYPSLEIYAHWRSVLWTLDMAAETIAELNEQSNRATKAIDTVLSQAAKARLPAPRLKELFSVIRINPVDTPHPTEYLSTQGIALYRALVGLTYETNPNTQEQKASELVKQMLSSSSITCDQRATTRAETITGLVQFNIYRTGTKQFRRLLQKALDTHFPNLSLTDKSYTPDIATGTWRAGGDADGKPNVTANVLLEGLTLNRLSAVNGLVSDLEEIKKEHGKENATLNKLETPLKTLQEALKAFDQQKPHTLDEKTLQKHSENLSRIAAQLPYTDLEKTFKQLEKELEGEALEKLKDMFFVFLQYGARGPRLDVRHNHSVFVSLINKIMTQDALKEFGLKYKSDLFFSQRAKEQQKRLMIQLETILAKDSKKMARFKALLWKISQADSEERELLKRFEIIKKHPKMFNRAIIAEADTLSMHYQNLIGLPFKLNEIAQHTPLAEDGKTLENVHLFSEDFENTPAGIKQKEAMGIRHALKKTGKLVAMPIMMARSDAQKDFGPAISLVQRKTSINVVNSALLKGGNLIKSLYNGCGMALGRGWSNPADITRITAQKIAQHFENTGRPVTNPALAMLARIIYTTQGRAPRILSAIPEQHANFVADQIAEILGRQIELLGLIPKGRYIYREKELSRNAKTFLKHIRRECTDHYYAFRHAQDPKGNKVIDSWADTFSYMHVLKHVNFSARPNARSKKKSTLSTQRAIGSNKALKMARTNHDNYYALDRFLREIMHGVQNHTLSIEDAKDIIQAPYIRHMLIRGAAALAAAQWSILYKGEEQTSEALYFLAKNTVFERQKDRTYKIIPPQTYDQDMALLYHAKIHESATEFALRLEACLTENFEQDLDDFKPQSPKIGPKTKDLYPWLEIEEQHARQMEKDHMLNALVNAALKQDPDHPALIHLARKSGAAFLSALRTPPDILFGRFSFLPDRSL